MGEDVHGSRGFPLGQAKPAGDLSLNLEGTARDDDAVNGGRSCIVGMGSRGSENAEHGARGEQERLHGESFDAQGVAS